MRERGEHRGSMRDGLVAGQTQLAVETGDGRDFDCVRGIKCALARHASEYNEATAAMPTLVVTGTAGVSPASSSGFIRVIVKLSRNDVAFNDGGETPAIPVGETLE